MPKAPLSRIVDNEIPRNGSGNPGDAGRGVVLPAPDSSVVNRGGTHTHKPGCNCNPCASRRRAKEALIRTAGLPTASAAATTNPGTGLIHSDIPHYTLPSARKRLQEKIEEFVRLRIAYPDAPLKELAKKLEVSAKTLSGYITVATEEGWLRFDDSIDRVEFELVPLAIQNAIDLMNAKDPKVTIETLKGTVFPDYRSRKGISENDSNVIAIRIEGSEGAPQLDIRRLGRPKVGTNSGIIDAEPMADHPIIVSDSNE